MAGEKRVILILGNDRIFRVEVEISKLAENLHRFLKPIRNRRHHVVSDPLSRLPQLRQFRVASGKKIKRQKAGE